MSAPKGRCPDCRELKAECACPEELPSPAGAVFGPEAVDAMAGFLRSIMQPEPHSGPPYVHVHKLPETEEEMAAAPFLPSLTITREGE